MTSKFAIVNLPQNSMGLLPRKRRFSQATLEGNKADSMKNKEEIQAVGYCDASVRGNYCGIGICLLDKDGKLIQKTSRRLPSHRNNNTKAEAVAIIETVKLCISKGFTNIRVYSDSKSLVKVSQAPSPRNGKSPVARQFLEMLHELKKFVKVSIRWVKGHARSCWNCLCDSLAREARWTIRDIVGVCKWQAQKIIVMRSTHA